MTLPSLPKMLREKPFWAYSVCARCLPRVTVDVSPSYIFHKGMRKVGGGKCSEEISRSYHTLKHGHKGVVRVFSVLNVARMQAPDTVTFSVAERGWGQSVCECVREGVFMSAFLRGALFLMEARR